MYPFLKYTENNLKTPIKKEEHDLTLLFSFYFLIKIKYIVLRIYKILMKICCS